MTDLINTYQTFESYLSFFDDDIAVFMTLDLQKYRAPGNSKIRQVIF